MPESLPHAGGSWTAFSNRTTNLALQLLLWVLLGGFYYAWDSRPNFHFDGPIWSLVLLDLVFAIGVFNALVYFIIPRWLLQGKLVPVLASLVVLVYVYGLWTYYVYRFSLVHLPLSADLAAFYQRGTQMGLQQRLFSWVGFRINLFDLESAVWFPAAISFLAYALVVDRRRLALERDQLGLELSYLKAQINPQFLFNTLGSLHSLTRAHDARAGDVVLHLADLMRYTLYETDTEQVLLSRELEFLEDYLALQRLRGYAQTVITHEVTGSVTTQKIAPLLLYPFLEQLFIGLEAPPDSPVTITSTVTVEAQSFTAIFSRKTSYPLAHSYSTQAPIVAARRRLHLLYPSGHTMQLRETEADVLVQLRIDW
ncbi:MAG TPA: histidine kinase [Hymenobacter sp.]